MIPLTKQRKYSIKTERLGIRNWLPSDIEPFSEMGQDVEVMKYFPELRSKEDSRNFIARMQNHFEAYGFCYFAMDVLETGEFIGFTGILNQNYESKFTPCVDIGWRLKKSAWGNGFATEAAKACLDFAFSKLNLNEIYSFATITNKGSEAVMKKIGMNYIDTFNHPSLVNHKELERCLVYKINKK